MNLITYIPYYLGQKIIINQKTYFLIGCLTDGTVFVKTRLTHQSNEAFNLNRVQGAKLVLRPLKNATPPQTDQFYTNAALAHNLKTTVSKNELGATMHFDAMAIKTCHNAKWLFEYGFDVFGLIEQDLAVERNEAQEF